MIDPTERLKGVLSLDDEQRAYRVHAIRWLFDRMHNTSLRLSNDDRQSVRIFSGVLGADVVRAAVRVGTEAAKEHRKVYAEYEAARQLRNQRRFPEALIHRTPDTPLTVVSAHYPLKADHEQYQNYMIDPLVKVLEGRGRGQGSIVHSRDEGPNRTEELARKGIHFLTLDAEHFEVVKEDRFFRYFRSDLYTPDELLDHTELKREHGDGEVVLLYDQFAKQGLDKMAVAVQERVGKYPHIGTLARIGDPYEGYHYWQVYEYVRVPEHPERPTLERVLGIELTTV